MTRYETGQLPSLNVQQHYNAIGESYEKRVGRHWRGKEITRRAVSKVMGADPKHILDLGAGTGISTRAILEVADPERLVAVDFSEIMLTQLLQNTPSDDRITTVTMEAGEYLTTTQHAFDLIVSMGMFQYFINPDGLLRGVAAALRPGGHFIFNYDLWIPHDKVQGTFSSVYESLHFYRMEPEHVEQNLINAGLLTVEHTTFETPPEHGCYVSGLIIAQKPPVTAH